VKRSYSRDYKLRIVKQILTGQMSIAQICRENNLGENVVRRWKHEYEEQGEAGWRYFGASVGPTVYLPRQGYRPKPT
jgi:transposase-like protein